MQRKRIETDIAAFPSAFTEILQNATLYDSSCSPEARVYFIDRDDGYYLKKAPKGSLQREAELTQYFHQKGLGTEILSYLSEECDWLLSRRMRGEDCTDRVYLDDPKRLCDTIATSLRALHEMDFSDCPVKDHTAHYLSVAKRNYEQGTVDLSFAPKEFCNATAKEAWEFLQSHGHLLERNTLLHGDYCLPNIMLDNWCLSGFIDLGNGGVGDRHVDLFWGAWTLRFNLGTDDFRNRFFDAYGRDKIDADRLTIVAVAECFG